jgi:hypothetical protein
MSEPTVLRVEEEELRESVKLKGTVKPTVPQKINPSRGIPHLLGAVRRMSTLLEFI